MEKKLYDADNCPCPATCDRNGKCDACKEAHHDKGSKTYCERVAEENAVDDDFDAG